MKLRFIVYQKTELLVRDRSVNFPAVFYYFIGVVPKWLKGAVCKTVIRRFESGRRLSRLNGLARVVELVDTMDLKSIVRKDVPVRVRPRVLIEKRLQLEPFIV